jgi:septal ring factor EnvC (AmiA/AmiB activator)
MPAAIDTLKFAKRLREANFTQTQAEALAEAVAEATVENVATKLDIAELKQEIADLRAELKQDIGALRAEFKQDNAGLRAEFKQDIADLRAELKQDIADLKQDNASLRTEIAALESRMLRWMGAGFAATIAVLAALMQFVHH